MMNPMTEDSVHPLRIHEATVQPEWIDYNGHVNDGYYVVAFTRATDAVQDLVGLDEAYRQSSGCSIYTVEAHLTYQREVPPETRLAFESTVLGVDAKRLHLFHRMVHADEGWTAATHELMLLHVDTVNGGTAPMPPAIVDELRALRDAHASLPTRPEVGSVFRPVRAD